MTSCDSHPLHLCLLARGEAADLPAAGRIIYNTCPLDTGCLEWTRATDRDGYGVTYYDRRQWRVHRLVYHLWVGDIPKKQMVLHKCDRPKCCHPDHLFIGDAGTNARDCRDKGRLGIAAGQKAWNARLTDSQAREILETYQWRTKGRTALALARRHHVSVGTVWGILRGETWKHIHPGEKI